MGFIKYKSLTIFIMIAFFLGLKAQGKKTVIWRIISPKEVVIGSNITLIFNVNSKPFWYIHSVNSKDRNGKNTSIWFRENADFKTIEKPEAIYEIEYFNRKTNQMEYIIQEEGGFAQKIKVLKANPIIKGQINYVLCNRGNNLEIPQVYHFEIQLKTNHK